MECKTQCLSCIWNNFLSTKIVLAKQASDHWFALIWHFWHSPGHAGEYLCHTLYVSEITRHFSTYICEHMFGDRTSHTFKHLQNSEHCCTLCSNDCFSILHVDYISTTFQLKIRKEAVHIQWEKPNHQLHHVNWKLFL